MVDTASYPGSGTTAFLSNHEALLNALAHPILQINPEGRIIFANAAAEQFFATSSVLLRRQQMEELVPFGSPLIGLIEQVQHSGSSVAEYGIDLSSPRIGEKTVDVQVAGVPEQPGSVLLMLLERTMAQKMNRQLTHRGAARSVTGMAAVLAHEIKNPLAGIRAAAQLLEIKADTDDRVMTRLICDEADRIRKLVDRMEIFSDNRPVERSPVNIHKVLERIRTIGETGFAKNIKIYEEYDPSLPPVYGNEDQLIQVFLNLFKNACDAVDTETGEITLSTAFRPGIRLSVMSSRDRVSLPLEVCVRDNGPGVPVDLKPHLFEPFVTTKSSGTGLGLALVAKIVGDHGGVIECDSIPQRTVFRVLLPMYISSAKENE